MSRNKYIKYCDKHRIDDGLLRNWLARELYPIAYDEIDSVIDKYRAKILALEDIKRMLNEDVL